MTQDTNSSGKKFYQSKTFWVNVISLAGLLVQTKTGFIVPAEVQAGILSVLNTVLRFTTTEPIQ